MCDWKWLQHYKHKREHLVADVRVASEAEGCGQHQREQKELEQVQEGDEALLPKGQGTDGLLLPFHEGLCKSSEWSLQNQAIFWLF